MMNYADDIGTTLRRLLVVLPSLAPEERKRVRDYMLGVKPTIDDVLAALEDKK
jgi:hypothetical protein